MLTTTQADMRDAVQRTANVVAFTDTHPPARINDLINQGLGALSRLCRTTNPKFQPVASTTITTDGVNTAFSLPVNFRSLISVEYTADEFKTWLEPFQQNERAALSTPEVTANATRAHAYQVLGRNLELLPRPQTGHTALVWFATTMTQLSSDGQTFDTMDRLDSWVIWWAAREIAMEREDWERHDRLSQKLSEMVDEIRILARSIDLNPARPVESDYADRDRYWPGFRRRYR